MPQFKLAREGYIVVRRVDASPESPSSKPAWECRVLPGKARSNGRYRDIGMVVECRAGNFKQTRCVVPQHMFFLFAFNARHLRVFFAFTLGHWLLDPLPAPSSQIYSITGGGQKANKA